MQLPTSLNRQSQDDRDTPKQLNASKISRNSEAGSNLSPFTWSNIKLPVVGGRLKSHSNSNKIKFHSKGERLIDIEALNSLESIEEKTKAKNKQSKLKANNKEFHTQKKRDLNSSANQQQAKSQVKKAYENKNKAKINLTCLSPHEHRISTAEPITLEARSKAYKSIELKGTSSKKNRYKKAETSARSREQIDQAKQEKERYLKQQLQLIQMKKRLSIEAHQANVHNRESNLHKDLSQRNQAQKPLNGHSTSPRHTANSIFRRTEYSQMEPYMRKILLESNWFATQNPKYSPKHQTADNFAAFRSENVLIWTRVEKSSIFRELRPKNQFYNHIQGSHCLTSKEKLHQLLSVSRGSADRSNDSVSSQLDKVHFQTFYPMSFSLPSQWHEFVEEYNSALVKVSLKLLYRQLRKQPLFVETFENLTGKDRQVELGSVIEDINKQNEQHSSVPESRNSYFVKLLLCLEHIRLRCPTGKAHNTYLNESKLKMQLTSSLQADLIGWCLDLIKIFRGSKSSDTHQKTQGLQSEVLSKILDLEKVDLRLLILLENYHKLFTEIFPSYLYQGLGLNNLWILKPFASSRGAGISMTNGQSEGFYKTRDYDQKQLKFSNRYDNKIAQKYIEQSLIVKKKTNPQTPLTDLDTLRAIYGGRKFDIRQWILVVSNPQKSRSKQKQRSIFKYEAAYCRFAQKPYKESSKNLNCHLTNYSLYQEKKKINPKKQAKIQSSVLMLDQILELLTQNSSQKNPKSASELRRLYDDQLNKIVERTLSLASKHMNFQAKTFELFGLDLILDSQFNLFLLEVNLNPMCEHERSESLKQQATKMVKGLFETVLQEENLKGKADPKPSRESHPHPSPRKHNLKHMMPGENWETESFSEVNHSLNSNENRNIVYNSPIQIGDSSKSSENKGINNLNKDSGWIKIN